MQKRMARLFVGYAVFLVVLVDRERFPFLDVVDDDAGADDGGAKVERAEHEDPCQWVIENVDDYNECDE